MAKKEYIGPKDSLDILLVGRTGDGKSETANTILGRETFPTSADAGSETTKAQYDCCHFEGKDIKVVDTPGLKDTRLGSRDDVQQLIDAIQIAIVNNPKGYHAIIYVIKFGNRFTREDELTILTLEVLLGDSFFKNHGILVVTYGDCFETEPTVITLHLSFEDWISRQDNINFKKLLQKCQNRAVIFDNRTDDAEKRLAQVRKLIEMIEGLSDKGNRYTNEDFDQVEKERKQLLLSLGEEQEKQDVIDKIGTLISKIKKATENNEGLEKLRLVSQEIDDLVKHLKTVLKDNKKLYTLSPLLNDLRKTLAAKKKQVENMIGYTDLLNKRKRDVEVKIDENKMPLTCGHADKDVRKKEIDIQKNEENKEIIDSSFRKSREEDLKATKKKIEDLEKKYIIEKNNNADNFTSPLRVFIKNSFSIKRFFDRISQLFTNY